MEVCARGTGGLALQRRTPIVRADALAKLVERAYSWRVSVRELETAVAGLSPGEFAEFGKWFVQFSTER